MDVLFEQHGSRITDFRRGQQLGERDHLVRWSKPRRPEWMSPQQYQAFADELTVREVKVDGRVLVTTMLDARQVRKGELFDLYACRWHVERDIRNIKTTLGMEVLRCLTPQMMEKELWVYLLAYNVMLLATGPVESNHAPVSDDRNPTPGSKCLGLKRAVRYGLMVIYYVLN